MADNGDAVLREVLRQALRVCRPGAALPLRPEPTWTQEQWWQAFCFLFLNQHTNSPARASLLEHSDDLLWFVTLGATPGSDTTATTTPSHARRSEEGSSSSNSRANSNTGRSGSASNSSNNNSNNGREGGLPAAGGQPPVWLRRNTAELPPELHPGGATFAKVDWFWSLCLNLVVQCKYGITVVQCRQDALAQVAQGQTRCPGAHAVTRRVYASPMRQEVVHLPPSGGASDPGAARGSGRPPAPCYPEVCFSVDDFDEAFGDMVLSQPGDCYCVVLHVQAGGSTTTPAPAATATATGASAATPATPSTTSSATNPTSAQQPPQSQGQTLPPPAPQPSHDSGNQHAITPNHSTHGQPQNAQPQQRERQLTLFSAYVTREQVASYLTTKARDGTGTGLGPLVSLLGRLMGGPRGPGGHGADRRERVVMSGPGGVGRAEAAVAQLPAAAGVGAVGGRAVAQAALLQMSLMWMSLPVGALAQAVMQFAVEGLQGS